MSYKVGVKTSGDRDWVYNQLRFATGTEASDYAHDLFSRWTLVNEMTVDESDDPVNYTFHGRPDGLQPVNPVEVE